MRKHLVNILLCLGTLLLGISIGKWMPFQLSDTLNQEATIPPGSVEPADNVEYANTKEMNLSEIRFVCRDDSLRPYWIDLLKEPQLNRYLLGAELQSEYDCAELLRVSEIDLNGDGKMEYNVTFDFCSARGNCPVALYGIFDDERSKMRTTAGTFDFSRRRLLFDLGTLGIEVQETKSHGYKDVVTTNNGVSAAIRLYRFDGDKYRVARCWEYDKPTDEKAEYDCSQDELEE